MNNVSYTVLKLTNGEDIICEVDYDKDVKISDRVFEIQNPLLMVCTREMRDDGVHEGLSLSRWVQPFTEQKYFTIPAASVVTTAEASPGLSKYYEYVLKRMENDIIQERRKPMPIQEPTDKELEEIYLEEEEEFLSLEGPSNKIH
tara:strand:- start:1107 stop:1541 length:435 start_codon:yes stop_codon:yes gene_type:complete